MSGVYRSFTSRSNRRGKSVIRKFFGIVFSHGLMWTAPGWQGLFQAVAARITNTTSLLVSSVSCLVKRAVSSSRPEIAQASRAVAVKQGRRPSPEAARSVLDQGEHDATLGQVGAISCSPIHCRDGSNFVFQMITTFSLDLESAARRWQRSGQSRPYVRPMTRQLPLAIMGVRMRVRHQSALACSRHVTVCGMPELS
jgi:hypothetical protein